MPKTSPKTIACPLCRNRVPIVANGRGLRCHSPNGELRGSKRGLGFCPGSVLLIRGEQFVDANGKVVATVPPR
jgi:hypothetical protein